MSGGARPLRRPSAGLRRHPRRATDLVEAVAARILCGLAVVVVVTAVVLGVDARARGVERAAAEAGERTCTTAVVLGPGEPVEGADPVAPVYRVPARWTSPGGAERRATLVVWSAAWAGRRVEVWTDRSGDLVSSPTSTTAAVAGAAGSAVLLLVAGLAGLFAAWRAVLAATLAADARAWGRAWDRIGPGWTGQGR